MTTSSSYIAQIVSAAIVLLVAVCGVVAEEPGEKILKLTGDSVEAKLGDSAGSMVFAGDVRLVRGAMTLEADRMTANREDGELITIEAVGEPVVFRKVDPAQQVTASAAAVTYDLLAQTLVLTGNVELFQEGNRIRGEQITYDLQKNELIAKSDESGDRQIEFVLENSE